MANHKFEYLFSNPDAYTTSLMQAVADMYGLPPVTALVQEPEFNWDFLEWEPETMEAELTRDLSFTPPEEVLTKIQAGCGLLLTNAFHTNVHVFCSVCQALSRGIPMTEWFIPSGLRDTAWGVLEANMLEGPSFRKEGFGPNVRQYVGLILSNHGVITPPAVLNFATGTEEARKRMQETIGDDPEMYQAALSRQDDVKDELQRYLNKRTIDMIQEWMSLPIPYLNRDGDVKELLTSLS